MNIRSVYTGEKHSASIRQIIKAIVELKGHSNWRDILESDYSEKPMPCLENIVRLSCIADHGDGHALVSRALEEGAPGATMMTGQELGSETQLENTSIRLSQEKDVLEMMLAPQKVAPIMAALVNYANTSKMTPLVFYTHPVPKAFTYLGEADG